MIIIDCYLKLILFTILIFKDSPSGHPLNLTLIIINSTYVSLHWERVECSKRNGNITGYIVQYHNDNNLLMVTVHGEDTLSVDLSGLVQPQTYSIGVAAMNNRGKGPFANITFDYST